MDFAAVVIFLILYFVRFHDWVPGMGGLNVVKPAILLCIIGLASRPPRAPSWGWMKTPHEWVIAAYLIYCIYVDPEPYDTFWNILPLAGFYFLTLQTLHTEQRLARFFLWWGLCVVFMCGIGVLTVGGFDLTAARDLIERNVGRLCLNTSLLDNPNAMGHTAVTAYALIYMTMVFRRPLLVRFLALPLLGIVTACVIYTESKGAYLSGAAVIASTLLLGRKWWVQILVAFLLVVGGSVVVSMLPRMVNREALRADEGVMGRLLAFEAARTAYQTGPTGWKRFIATIEWEGDKSLKATHSSIVQVGADLGPIGLFLYLSALCCAGRTVLRYRTDSDDLERSRRIIFALMVGYFVSGWMINRSYHAEYFLMIAAATAYHKLALERLRGQETAEEVEPDSEAGGPETEGALTVPAPAIVAQPVLDHGGGMAVRESAIAKARRFWNRYGLIDFGLGYGALAGTVWIWSYIIDNL